MPVLDTSFLIDVQHQAPTAQDALRHLRENGDALLVPAQAAIEFLHGFEDQVRALHRLEESFRLVELDRETILETAFLSRQARRNGFPPQWEDAQIAAVASLEQTYVVTANPRHFEQLSVPCWDYRMEPEPPA